MHIRIGGHVETAYNWEVPLGPLAKDAEGEVVLVNGNQYLLLALSLFLHQNKHYYYSPYPLNSRRRSFSSTLLNNNKKCHKTEIGARVLEEC